jgi:hypothetical protein
MNEEDKTKQEEDEHTKKAVAEVKAANELYSQKLRALNEKRTEFLNLQSETLEALQKAASLNDQFNTAVNRQLLSDRDKLQEEVKKLKIALDKKKSST